MASLKAARAPPAARDAGVLIKKVHGTGETLVGAWKVNRRSPAAVDAETPPGREDNERDDEEGDEKTPDLVMLTSPGALRWRM